MNLAKAPQAYDAGDQDRVRAEINTADAKCRKRGQDIELGGNRLILTAPNGTRYQMVVSNIGVITATAV